MAASGTTARALLFAAVLFAAGFLLGWWAGSRGVGVGAGSRHEHGRVGGAPVDLGQAGAGSPGTGAVGAGSAVAGGGEPGAGESGASGASGIPAGGDPREAGASSGGSGASGTRPGSSITDRAGPDEPGKGTSAAAPAGRGAPPPYDLPEKIAGKLVDARTGKPIPGARVELLWATSDGTQSGAWGEDLREDGSFSIEAVEKMRRMAEEMFRGEFQRGKFKSPDEAYADLEYRLRVSAKGYETFEKGDPGKEFEVSLEPESRDHLPGSVRVDARWPDDSRFQGRLLVNVSSHDRGLYSQWALPDHDGTYLLPGIPAGRWSFNVAGKRNTGTDLDVPEAAEARVSLRVPRKGVEEPRDVPAGEPREVSVSTGSGDAGPGACVRAEARPGLFFRVEVTASTALFPSLPAGKWEFVLQAPDRPEVRFAAEIPAGTGRLSLRFP